MDQDLSLAQMLVAKRALPPAKLQETLDACRNAGVPLGRYAAESGCVERAPLLECLREMNGGIGDGRGYAAVEDALLASEVIADGLTSQDVVERLRADVFAMGGRLGDALAAEGHVAPDQVSACVYRVKERSGICPTCFSTFENDWLRSVSAAACPICVEPWDVPGQAPPFRGNGNGNGNAAFDEAATVIGSVETNPFDEEATVVQGTMGETFEGMDPRNPASSGAVPTGEINFAQTVVDVDPTTGAPVGGEINFAQTVTDVDPTTGASASADINFARTISDDEPGGGSGSGGFGDIHHAQTVTDVEVREGPDGQMRLQPVGGSHPGSAFGQPPSGAFGVPASGFGQPPSGAFSQPASGFGQQPGSGAFGVPPSGAYGQPPSGAYGQPGSGAFGVPPSGAFGQPPSGGYGVPPSGAFGQPGSGAFGVPPSNAHLPGFAPGTDPNLAALGSNPHLRPVSGTDPNMPAAAFGSGGFAPASGGFAPASGGFAPASGGFAPASGGFAPASGGNLQGAPTAIMGPDEKPGGAIPVGDVLGGSGPGSAGGFGRASNEPFRPASAAPMSGAGISGRTAPVRRSRRRPGMSHELLGPDAGFRAYLPFIALGLAGAAGLIVLAALLMTGGGEKGRELRRKARAKKAGGDLEEAVLLYTQALELLGGTEAEEIRTELEESEKIRQAGKDATLNNDGAAAFQLVEYALTGRDIDLRLKALEDLTLAKDKTTPAHLKELVDKKGEDARVKKEALRAIATTGGPDSLEYIGRAIAEGLLRDPEAAFTELLKANDPRAVTGLLDLLKMGSAQAEDKKKRACERLGYFKKRSAVPVLLEMIEKEPSDGVRAAAIEALGNTAPAEGVTSFVAALLDEGDKTVEAALQALERANDKAVPPLEKKLLDGEPLAALALTRIKSSSSAKALKNALGTVSWGIRGEILAKVVESKFPRHLLQQPVRDVIQQALNGTGAKQPKRLEIGPLIAAAEYFQFEEEQRGLLALQLYLECKALEGKTVPLEMEDITTEDEDTKQAVIYAGNGTLYPVKIAFFANDGFTRAGFALAQGERDEATIEPGQYTVIVDQRAAKHPLKVGQVEIKAGQRFKISLGIDAIGTDEDGN